MSDDLTFSAWNHLKLTELFRRLNWPEEKIQLAMTQVIARAVYPASELATSKWTRDNSAVCDITGYNREAITKDKLYQSRNIPPSIISILSILILARLSKRQKIYTGKRI